MFAKLKARQQAQAEAEARKSPEEKLEDQAKNGRATLHFLTGISLFNMFMLLIGSDTILVFAPSLPYLGILLGQALDAVAIAVIVGLILSAPYSLCALWCKKSPAGMLAAAIFFILDFVGMMIFTYLFMDSFLDNLLDIVAHIAILLVIFVGWGAQKKYHEMRSQGRDTAYALYSTDPEKF